MTPSLNALAAASKGAAFAAVIAKADAAARRNAGFMRGIESALQQDLACT